MLLARLLLAGISILAASCARPGFRPAQLRNSDFEQPLDSGWTVVVINDSNTAGYIERCDTLGQPGGGYAARVFKLHKQFCSLSQETPVETLDQVVRFLARLRLGGSVPCSPVAAVAFDYLDVDGGRLGRTMFYLPSQYNTWTSSDSLHLIRVTDTTGRWTEHQLNLREDIAGALPAVDPAEVARLRVELFASVDYSG